MPVLLPVLGAENRRPLVVAELEDLEQEAPEAVVWPAEQPFVEDEDLERAILPHGLRDPSWTLLGILPSLLEVGASDVVRAHPRGACLLGKRAGKIGLSGACRPEEHDILASRGEAAGRELAYEHAVETALRLRENGATGESHGEVVVVTIGPDDAGQQLRSALAMGADRAIRIDGKDEALDARVVATALAKLVEITA